MKKVTSSFVVMLLVILTVKAESSVAIRINSLGYPEKSVKRAVVLSSAESFKVINSKNGKVVLDGKLSDQVTQDDVGQSVRFADFSNLEKRGQYHIYVEGVEGAERSIDFEIGKNIYKPAYILSMRAFYLWRCGIAVKTEYNGNIFSTEACHLDDGWLDYIGSEGEKRDGTGGWHDAGDYGKYTVNAGITLGVLFYAWDHFGDKLKKISLNIPRTASGMPDFLQELKWETDFILKMQYQDGSGRVSHKLTRKEFSGFIMPQEDKEKRYFTEWSSAATADFIAIMAMAARYFAPYDAEYAKKCLAAAQVSYNFLSQSAQKNFIQGDFSTGGYQTTDADDRLWAAVEMWESTGNPQYLQDAESRIESLRTVVAEDWDWGSLSNMGVFTYALSERSGKNPEIDSKVNEAIIKVADKLVETAAKDIYSRALGGRYYWGCNGTVARQAINLHVAELLNGGTEYRKTIQGLVDHLFGYNYYGRSYVTGVGINPPLNPHDRRSAADGIEAPWPGYLVGGGHTATDWVDEEEDYARNEIAINWQAALVYLLASTLD
ncbi:MAG TPA: glycoside hydrolase family 9 protein [Bacteroidaceae bacterium]|nr:glycoside hydrolase family 9 protein [Bacteroidaceae bacterium]